MNISNCFHIDYNYFALLNSKIVNCVHELHQQRYLYNTIFVEKMVPHTSGHPFDLIEEIVGYVGERL